MSEIESPILFAFLTFVYVVAGCAMLQLAISGYQLS